VRHDHDHSEPERVLEQPHVEEHVKPGRIEDVGHGGVDVEQRHDEQGRQGRSQLEAVQGVEVGDGVADELVSELEPLHVLGERRTTVRGGGGGGGGGERTGTHQHGRVPVDGDRLGLERGQFAVDLAEHAAQLQTVDDELQFGEAHAGVLHVHEHVERDDAAVPVPQVQQVDPVRVHRHYERGARDPQGGREHPAPSRAARVHRIVGLVLGGARLVRGHRARRALVRHRRPGHHAPDGHGPREYHHDHRGGHRVAVAHRADHVRRPRVVVHARHDQRGGRHRARVVARRRHGRGACMGRVGVRVTRLFALCTR